MSQNRIQNEKKHNYFYKITNLVNGKYYYGIYSTNKDKYDYYLGSGVAIKSAIEKYGKENFIKEIIADYPTRKEASDHEKRIVTQRLVDLEECYNLKTGGDNGALHSIEVRQRIGSKSKGRLWSEELKSQKSIWAKQQPLSEEFIDHIFKPGCFGEKNRFFGKKHTEESIRNMSINRSGSKNYRSIKILHVESGTIFDTKTEAKKYFKLTDHRLTKQINLGAFQIVSSK